MLTIAPARTRCPQCGRGHLTQVRTAAGANLLCSGCGACWEPARHWLCRVDPATCPGCAFAGLCAPEGPDDTAAAAG